MYQYTECGLDNVWLENGYAVKETRYGQAVSVENADELHQLLARQVACKMGSLTGKEFRFLRGRLLLSQRMLGEMLGVSEQTVSLWERNEHDIPVASEAVLRVMVLQHMDRDGDMRKIIERVNTVDRLVNQRIVAKAEDHRWVAAQAPEPEMA